LGVSICRVDPQIKEEIIDEASMHRMTTSNYIETILKNRQDEEIPIDMELENDLTIHELNEELELLKHELEEMTSQRDGLLEGQLEDSETQKKYFQLEQKIFSLRREPSTFFSKIKC